MAYLATQLPADVFDTIQRNAGVLLSEFDATSWAVDREHIIGATSGGINFKDELAFVDMGDDIDNCPKNMMELKELDSRVVTCSGTYVAVRPEEIKNLAVVADMEGNKITPRNEIKLSDYRKIWFVCDYGKDGAIAVELENVINESGFAIQTANKGKGQFAFNYKAHYSIDNPDTVPYGIHIKDPSAAATASVGDEEPTAE